jgi:TRAP transporter TAXI family solute receptor
MATEDNRIKQVAKKVKMVFPLYNEEVHIVVNNKQISTFSDLEGKVVAIGKEGSGSYLTANLLFQLAEIVPAKRAEVGGKEAIKALLDGDIDAMLYVAEYPVKLFQETAPNGYLHLVPITHKNITEFYPISTIPAFTYAWQTNNVSTIAAKAVLITYDYKWWHCENVGHLAKIMYNNLDWLKQHGHEKWKNVDFDFQLRKWDQYRCVKKQIGQAPPEESHTSPHRMGDILMRGLKDQFK